MTLKILAFFMGYHFTFSVEKRKQIEGHQTNNLSGGPNLTPPPQILSIIQYKTLKSGIACHFL